MPSSSARPATPALPTSRQNGSSGSRASAATGRSNSSTCATSTCRSSTRRPRTSGRRARTRRPSPGRKPSPRFDGFIFVTAEYNRSITGALKNALDQAYREWIHKPAAILGYGSTGGARAVEHLRTHRHRAADGPGAHGVHIMGADLMKVHPMGGVGAPISEIEDAHPAERQGDARRPRLVDPRHDGRPRRDAERAAA